MESDMEFRTVPDEMREREPLVKGREPRNALSKALLGGGTYFIAGPKKTWGSIYTLAKNHSKVAHVKRTEINGIEGTLIWFE
jgi:hypothetical protein